ncbi:hypothetical protein PX52LOC_04600 [Limnoglobus roseus]|uniref:Uncharacterized protein n=1 Tax=Limnoglobus roseus TaxID=2598579 RepID=A0A5C1AKC4_9BACT|nr:hypothetical protein PX52LOC_04600 [Limnoglobus roseus]
MLLPALSAISRATVGAASVPSYTINDWDTASDEWLDKTEVKALYNECLSYGMVERNDRSTWRWSHQIVARYLATRTEGSE